MWDFMTNVIHRLWSITRKAMAFNVMSKQVRQERADLFHVSLDQLADFLYKLAGRSITIRSDYGLFESTCYVRKEPRGNLMMPPAAGSATVAKADASYLCRPRLPAVHRLTPYIEEINRRRWYTNFGEAALELTARLAAHFGLESGQCVTASSGTDALTAAIIAVAGRASAERPYCLMPSYTFVGTAAAALNAGYEPYFVDIDPETLAIVPDRLLSLPILRQTGAIIAVGPYGRPVIQRDWERLYVASGVPIVIDAAAGFDAVAVNPDATLGSLPVMLSLHATKVFGVGEGGLILCRNAELVRRCLRTLNFGFLGSREALVAGFNGKMSEYHAAVGLAAFDAWPATRAGFLTTAEAYRQAADRWGLSAKIFAETAWASGYVLYWAPNGADAARAERLLSEAGIGCRRWYGTGCHRHPAYADFRRDPLPATEEVSPRIIGLPVAVDMPRETIEEIIMVLARV
jgi:dTDP-4-amino-4,6-dideoxygalactose transaminase